MAAPVPDYELDDEVVIADDPAQHKALGDPLRLDILDLVLERAASVADLAAALGRPRSTVAYHVDRLVEAGLLRVVRTRRVRAVDERFYGRTGRTIVLGSTTTRHPARGGAAFPFLETAAEEAREAAEGEDGWSTLRHARIPTERAAEFFHQIEELAARYTTLERGGDTVYGFVAAVYPTDRPRLPEPPA